jgi:outer membrane lipoprotein-sorting protein
MKKLFLTVSFLIVVLILNAQSLEDIINKYSVANKLDKISNFKTIKITAKTSMMGMDMPMEMWMKNPNKIKTVTSFNGQDMVQVFDGEKGYTINPMAGSNTPVEMTADQINTVIKNNIFQNYMASYLKSGQLTLAGEDNVNGKPAYKIKADIGEGNTAMMYIDKSSYLILKTVADVNQGGMAISVESYPSDYTETSGIMLPMKTTTSASGMEIVTIFTKVEVDVPIDDSVFKIK